jgi:hypothetical protein
MKNYLTTKQPNTKPLNKVLLFSTLALLFFATNLTAQIKVWNNNHVTMGWANAAPIEQLNIKGDFYLHPLNTTSGGFSFENYNNVGTGGVTFNEPILRPQFHMSMWLGNDASQLYRVYSRRLYQSQGAGVWSFSDSRLKMNINPWDESALSKLALIKAYRYDLDPAKFGNVPEEKMALLTKQGENQIGFLAQEIKTVFPEMVDVPEEGYMAVNYGMLIPVLLEAIKEQQQLILELQVKVEALEAK